MAEMFARMVRAYLDGHLTFGDVYWMANDLVPSLIHGHEDRAVSLAGALILAEVDYAPADRRTAVAEAFAQYESPTPTQS